MAETEKRFSIDEAVSFGWDVMKNNISFFILVILILWVAEAIPSGLESAAGYMPVAAAVVYGIIFGLLSFVVGMFINMAQVKIGLRFCSGETADFQDLCNEYPHFLDFVVGSILYTLIVIGGLILLIVPGIYWAIKYHFFGYLIIDQGMGPFDALKRSGEITKGVRGHLFLFGLALIGINILGFLACCVGLFATIPTALVATAYVYRTLLAATPAQQEARPELPPQPEQPASP